MTVTETVLAPLLRELRRCVLALATVVAAPALRLTLIVLAAELAVGVTRRLLRFWAIVPVYAVVPALKVGSSVTDASVTGMGIHSAMTVTSPSPSQTCHMTPPKSTSARVSVIDVG